MDATVPDDKVQAVVGLVLQAVDQRLATVREQLLHITNAIAHNHTELSRRMDDCQRLSEAAMQESTTGSGAAAATGQLVHAANTLTERVEFLESRVNQYTNDRIAEVTALIHQMGGIGSGVPAAAMPMAAAAAPPVAPVARPVTIAPVEVEAPAVATAPAPVEPPIDIALLSAQMSERLAAAVDRALGSLAGDVGAPVNSA